MARFAAMVALSSLLWVAAGRAHALPRAGAHVGPLVVDGLDGRSRLLPDGKRAVLLFYEDQDAGAQNQRVRAIVGPITDRVENRALLELVPVADVERWNFWPARRYVFSYLKQVAERETTSLWCDWKGLVRAALGLTRGKSGVILIDALGTCRFAAEGPLSDGQISDLIQQLSALGVAINDRPTAAP